MIPRDYQIEMAKEGYLILKEYMIVYLAAQERVGKSLSALLIAEMCQNVKTVQIITKKKALVGWQNTLANYNCIREVRLTTYTQLHNTDISGADLYILDESHNYISGSPKLPQTTADLKVALQLKPIIYISATPHAQGYHQLYHQFFISSWSPWKKWDNFYHWFADFGVPDSVYIQGKAKPIYTKTKTDLCKRFVEHLFVTKTRKELDFPFEPIDKIHYVELDQETKDLNNTIVKERIITFHGKTIVCDTAAKRRFTRHMLEGGVAKYTEPYLDNNGDPKLREYFLVLHNCEKIDYIKKTWGDTEDLVIFYNFIAEKTKLDIHFKKARILQATSFAEGVELSMYEHIVVYSQDYSTARHTQRRARQASMDRNKPIFINFLLVENGVSEQVYEIVSIKKQNFVDSVYEDTYL